MTDTRIIMPVAIAFGVGGVAGFFQPHLQSH